MYKFTKEKIKNQSIDEGIHPGILINIEDTTSQKGDRMFKLTWKIGHHIIIDHVMPEHHNETARRIAETKLSCMAEFMLGALDNQQVELMDCLNKKADLLIKLKQGTDGNMYPRVIAIKKSPSFKISREGSTTTDTPPNTKEVVDDDIPW